MIEENHRRVTLNNIRSRVIESRKKYTSFVWIMRILTLSVIVLEVSMFGEPDLFGIVDPTPYVMPFIMIFIEYFYWKDRKNTNEVLSNVDYWLSLSDELLSGYHQDYLNEMIGDLEKVYGKK